MMSGDTELARIECLSNPQVHSRSTEEETERERRKFEKLTY